MTADICAYACTGDNGRQIVRQIVKHAETPTILLLAGRNVQSVRALQSELLRENTKVDIRVYSEAVNVDDDDALQSMVSQVRGIVVNCIAEGSHPREFVGVAEACARQNVSYMDMTAIYSSFGILFYDQTLQNDDSSKLVPACGFDYAFHDVAVLQAERAFLDRFNNAADKVQVTMALRTGPLGVKWRLSFAEKILRAESRDAPQSNATTTGTSPVSKQQLPSPTAGSSARLLAYITPLNSWSIPWPLGGDAVTFLLSRRNWSSENVDVRMALPQSLWRAAFLLVYGLSMVACFGPLFAVARFLRIKLLQKCLLWLLPTISLGFFCADDDLVRRANDSSRVELLVSLKSAKGQELSYHVTVPWENLHPLCVSLAALELAALKDRETGVLTPAQALGNTEFWSRLRKACNIVIQIS
jgi:short subunit dehydrogenase-like uncharacterized protein